MKRLCLFAFLFALTLPSYAQIKARDSGNFGKVRWFEYLIPADQADATETVAVDVSRASAFNIVLATADTVTASGPLSATKTVQILIAFEPTTTSAGMINSSTSTWVAATPDVGSATALLQAYGAQRYDPGAAVTAKASVNAHNEGLIIQFAIKEEEN